jgi:hypothetical protein
VINSQPFTASLSTAIPAQFSHQFLMQCLARHTAQSLSRDQLDDVTKYIKAQCDTLLFKVFAAATGGDDASHSFVATTHRDVARARLAALQSVLHKRYPLLATEGCASLSRPPVFYVTEGSPLLAGGGVNRLAWELLAAPSSFTLIPLRRVAAAAANTNASGGGGGGGDGDDVQFATYEMDVDALEREVESDKAKGRLPCAVLATIGADRDRAYQLDDMRALRKVCDRHGLWLHGEGTSLLLATSTSPATPSFAKALFDCADSLCCQPLAWFDVRGALGVTFTRAAAQHAQYLAPPEPTTHERFTTLFLLWHQLVCGGGPTTTTAAAAASDDETMLAVYGPAHVTHTVTAHLDACAYLCTLLRALPFKVAIGPGAQHPHVVFFQLSPPADLSLADFHLDVNSFNKYLFSRLLDNDNVNIPVSEIVYQDALGFLFDPLASLRGDAGGAAYASVSSRATIRTLVKALETEIELIQRCADARAAFKAAVDAHAELVYVPPVQLPGHFVGVGAVRFRPVFAVPPAHLDALNALLAHTLSLSPHRSLYVGSITTHEQVCTIVQTAPVVADANCAALIVAEIVDAAAKLELPPEVIQGLSDVVVRGIRDAEERMQSLSVRAYRPNALLSRLPVVGGFFSWFGGGGGSANGNAGTADKSAGGGDGLEFDLRADAGEE